MVSAIPTLVPTHRSPLAALRAVTKMDLRLLDTSRAARTRDTLLAMLMSWGEKIKC